MVKHSRKSSLSYLSPSPTTNLPKFSTQNLAGKRGKIACYVDKAEITEGGKNSEKPTSSFFRIHREYIEWQQYPKLQMEAISLLNNHHVWVAL